MTSQEKIDAIRQTFSPKIKLGDLQKIARKDFKVESDAFYGQIEALISGQTPSFKDDYESKWAYFFLPLDDDGVCICTAVSVFLSYKKTYYVTFDNFSRSGGPEVVKGPDEVPKHYVPILDEIHRFMPLVNEHGDSLVEALYPYKWRTGRIRRKFITDPSRLMSEEAGERLLSAYEKHLDKNLSVSEISLNDYLRTAEICYYAAFPKDIRKLSKQLEVETIPMKRLHKQWADGRHGGMLLLEDPDSKKEYMDWLLSREWQGAHPFEIVYSGNVHGISLDPPNEENHHYRISVIDPFYYQELLDMVAALIEKNVPFETFSLKEIVEYCKGEVYIDVNKFSMRGDFFTYRDSAEEREDYFSHIEWDQIQRVKPCPPGQDDA